MTTVYMLIADGTIDQIVETLAIAKRERRDLEKLGCTVTVKIFPDWSAAEAYQSKTEGN